MAGIYRLAVTFSTYQYILHFSLTFFFLWICTNTSDICTSVEIIFKFQKIIREKDALAHAKCFITHSILFLSHSIILLYKIYFNLYHHRACMQWTCIHESIQWNRINESILDNDFYWAKKIKLLPCWTVYVLIHFHSSS